MSDRPTIYVHPRDLQTLRERLQGEGRAWEEIPGGIRVPEAGLDMLATEQARPDVAIVRPSRPARPDVEEWLAGVDRLRDHLFRDEVAAAPTTPDRAQRRAQRRRKL